jgi:hypothetical protein
MLSMHPHGVKYDKTAKARIIGQNPDWGSNCAQRKIHVRLAA